MPTSSESTEVPLEMPPTLSGTLRALSLSPRSNPLDSSSSCDDALRLGMVAATLLVVRVKGRAAEDSRLPERRRLELDRLVARRATPPGTPP